MSAQLPVKVTPKPNVQVAPFVRAFGEDVAAEFLLRFGGSVVTIAVGGKTRSGSGYIESFVGAEAYERLIEISKDEGFPDRIPLANRWLATYFACRGLNNSEIARRLRVTDNTVRKLVRAGRERMLRGLAP